MASLCCVSLRQLERFCKQYLHTTPSDWLRQLQCRLAKQLISEGFSSKATAAELKFSNESHFCREFKKIFSTSPQTFSPTFKEQHKMSLLDNDVANGQSLLFDRDTPFRFNLTKPLHHLAQKVSGIKKSIKLPSSTDIVTTPKDLAETKQIPIIAQRPACRRDS